MKAHLNDSGTHVLVDDAICSWQLDTGLRTGTSGFTNADPLVLPAVGAWEARPDAETRIPNLVLCGDYVRGEHQMANMEAANASGRSAANVVLERSGVHEEPATVLARYHAPEWEPLRRVDNERYRLGQPNMFDTHGLT